MQLELKCDLGRLQGQIDLGALRLLKSNYGIDMLVSGAPDGLDFYDIAEKIFVCSVLRYYNHIKVEPKYSIEELEEGFNSIDLRCFNNMSKVLTAVVTSKPIPELMVIDDPEDTTTEEKKS